MAVRHNSGLSYLYGKLSGYVVKYRNNDKNIMQFYRTEYGGADIKLDTNSLYKKHNDLKGQKQKIGKSLER